MFWNNKFLSAPVDCVETISPSLCGISFLRFQSVSSCWNTYNRHNSCFGGNPYYQDFKSWYKLQQAFAPPLNASTRWQRKRKSRLVSDTCLYSLSWVTSSFGWQSSSAARKSWDLVHVTQVSNSSYKKSPLQARELAQQQIFLSWEKVAGSGSNLFVIFFLLCWPTC